MTTDWTKTKVYTISLNGLTEPREIIQLIQNLNIKKYTYEIRHKNVTIKFGMSDAMTTRKGERIYRQIGHLDSFGDKKIIGPNGGEFLDINEEYKFRYSHDMNHNDITITIWSFDYYNFRTTNTTKEVGDAETELMETYKKQYGELPIGNINDNTLIRKKPAPRKDVWEKIFI